MISLNTGLPGHGKTLRVIWFVQRYVEAENKRLAAEAEAAGTEPLVRQVYYSGIKDLSLPWIECDSTKWFELPPGSIIVVDECQKVFPCLPSGAKRPDHYTKLATHRHDGFDLFFITQQPSLLDNFARALCESHSHSVRKFGMQRATIYKWDMVQQQPRSLAAQKSALVESWSYPKEVYGYYKSAEVHTVIRRIPPKLIFAVLFVLSMPVLFWYVLDSYQSRMKKPENAAVASSASDASLSDSASGGVAGHVDPMQDARRYVHSNTPRVEGVAHSAPKYDEITKPVRAPVPAMCIKRGNRCQCYSQQATKLNMPTNMCLDIAYNGYFQEFDPNGRDGGSGDRSIDQSRSRGDAQVAKVDDRVVVLPYTPDPPRYAGGK
jgi:zona occludens toxin